MSVSAASMPAASSDEKNDNVKKNEMEVMPPAVKYPPHLGIGTNAAFVVSVFASIAVPFALCITCRLPVSIRIAVTSIAAVTLAVLRIIVVDVAYAATLWDYNDPRLVPEPDSRFVEVGGADVHIQSVGRDDIASRTASGTDRGTRDEEMGVSVLCVHGFGASARSFCRVGPRLGRAIGATTKDGVRAFDMPGFGFTSRPKKLKAYGVENAAFIGSELIDLIRNEDRAADAKRQMEGRGRGRGGVVLMGHSLGANVAIRAAKKACENAAEKATSIVPAIILIAPAITAAAAAAAAARARQESESEASVAAALGNILRRCFHTLANVFSRMFSIVAAGLILGPARRILYSLLRRLVNNDNFWRVSLKLAFFAEETVNDATVETYASPRRVKGWDRGMVMFVASQLLAFAFSPSRRRGKTRGDADDDALAWVSKAGIPILIVHGDADQIVPLKNSADLATGGGGGAVSVPSARGETRALIGSRPELAVLRCGHNPHEELPAEFVDCCMAFLRRCGAHV